MSLVTGMALSSCQMQECREVVQAIETVREQHILLVCGSLSPPEKVTFLLYSLLIRQWSVSVIVSDSIFNAIQLVETQMNDASFQTSPQWKVLMQLGGSSLIMRERDLIHSSIWSAALFSPELLLGVDMDSEQLGRLFVLDYPGCRSSHNSRKIDATITNLILSWTQQDRPVILFSAVGAMMHHYASPNILKRMDRIGWQIKLPWHNTCLITPTEEVSPSTPGNGVGSWYTHSLIVMALIIAAIFLPSVCSSHASSSEEN